MLRVDTMPVGGPVAVAVTDGAVGVGLRVEQGALSHDADPTDNLRNACRQLPLQNRAHGRFAT